MMKYYKIILLFCLLSGLKASSQTPTVESVLTTVHQKMQDLKQFSLKLDYSLYPTYTATEYTEHYVGAFVKANASTYTKINATTFINTPNSVIKINDNQKAIEFGEIKVAGQAMNEQSPLAMLSTFIKFFKTKTITDKGAQWLCTFTTDVITQLPYGKVEIYINKKTHVVTHQVLYFLAQVPYTNTEGERVLANPRLEIKLSDFSTTISNQELLSTKASNYIKFTGKKIVPVKEYKNFKLIKTN